MAMLVTLRNIGNCKGLVLPKPVLAQAGMAGETNVELTVEDGAIVLRRACPRRRAGWNDAARAVVVQGGDELVMGEFANEADTEIDW